MPYGPSPALAAFLLVASVSSNVSAATHADPAVQRHIIRWVPLCGCRLSSNWPTPFPMWPSIAFASFMTFCLLTSSLTMALAVSASKRGDRAAVVKFMLLTMLGGAAFIVLHVREWLHLIGEGVRPWSNPWGSPLFGASFFGLTGLHMFHVFSGVIYLGIVALGVGKGWRTHEDVEICGLYWHFVDLVWMFIFPLIYLMSVAPR